MFAKKAEKAGLFKEKNLHDITQKTLNNLNKQFKRDHGTSITTEVKKVFQEERKQIIHNPCGKRKHRAAMEGNCDRTISLNLLIIFISIYFHFG